MGAVNRLFFMSAALVGAAMMASSAAKAADCAPEPSPGLPCNVAQGDVLDLPGGSFLTVPSSGQDKEATVEAALFDALDQILNVELVGKSDEAGDGFSATGGNALSGTWSYSGPAPGPREKIAYLTVKSGTGFALFDINTLITGTNPLTGTWSTNGVLNNGGQLAGMSHVSLWKVVPEPGSLLLLLFGLFALTAWQRRLRQALPLNT